MVSGHLGGHFGGHFSGHIANQINILYRKSLPTTTYSDWKAMAGETRFEHATYGFGDRYSTIEPLP